MRYIMLIYSGKSPNGLSPEQEQAVKQQHWALIEDATRRGILRAVEPLSPASNATSVRVREGKTILSDGPFAETKEQLAGFYVLDCKDLDEAIEWAARIPTLCQGDYGCIEVRPLPGLPVRQEEAAEHAVSTGVNG